MIEKFLAARRAAVPILGIETPDPQVTVYEIAKESSDFPVAQWDIVRGMLPLTEKGRDLVSQVCGSEPPEYVTVDPVNVLQRLGKITMTDVVVLMHNAPAFFNSAQFVQAVWNLRDKFKSDGSMLVLLAPSIRLPSYIKNDVMVIEEPLPDVNELRTIVNEIFRAAGMKDYTEEFVEKTARSLLGLSAFSAEQSLATSLKRDNGKIVLDQSLLWEKKCKVAEQTKGISIYRGKETFDDVVGYDNVKSFLSRIMQGPEPPEVVVFMDEIEKALAGFGSDTSGVTGEMLGKLLTWMQMIEALGVLFIGPPGSGESLVGLSTGNTFKKPTVIFDLSSMKGSLVGESVAALAEAQKVVTAMAGGMKVLVLATCNRLSSIPPELKRRFSLGTFFFDLPTPEELKALWNFYMKKFSLNDTVNFDNTGWTGAEVKNCCNIAWRLSCSLAEASTYVVPVYKSAHEEIENLRKMADGKFTSASSMGVYRTNLESTSTQRKLSIGGER